jgi:hypothetical protein
VCIFQIKESKMKSTQNVRGIVNLVFKAVAVAMGVAVIVLGALGAATPATHITLLDIGLFTLSVSAMQGEAKEQ